MSLRNPNKEMNRFNTFIFGTYGNYYVINYMNFTNVQVHDVYYNAMLLFSTSGSVNDEIYVDNILFDNVNANDYVYFFMHSKIAVISNFTYQNSYGMSVPVFSCYNARNLTLNDFILKNYTGVPNPIYALINYVNTPTTLTYFNGIRIEDSHMVGSQLIEIISDTFQVSLARVVILNSDISSGKEFIYLTKVRNIELSGWFIYRFVNSDEENEISTILSIGVFDLEGDYRNDLYENVTFSESSVAFIIINGFISTPTTYKNFIYSNFRFVDMSVDINLNMIDTSGINYASDIRFEFKNFTFSNITYSAAESLLKLGQLLPSELVIRDSSFTDLSSTKILIGTAPSTSSTQRTRVRFINTVFDSFFSVSDSIVSVYNGATAEFENCTFTNLHNLVSGAAITAGQSKANVVISDSSFFNNSAVEGSIFNIEAESAIRCNKWEIYNNFALTSGVAKIASNGYFYFYDSVITKNYAKNNPISLVFDTINPVVFDNWEIHDNKMMTAQEILNEINSIWNYLWFLSQQLEDYIVENSETLKSEASFAALLQLISGAVEFINSTSIYNEETLLSAFVSSVSFSGSTVSSIRLFENAISIISSTLEFTDMSVSNITTSNNSFFIDVGLGSNALIEDCSYSHSASKMLNLLSSEGIISNIEMRNVTNVSFLIEIYNSDKVQISKFVWLDSYSTSKSLISVKKSNNFTLNDLIFSGLNQTLVIFTDSHVKEIINITITSSLSPLIFENSKIDKMTNWAFFHNGNKNIFKGGALSLLNSEMHISNSSFVNNTAESGGAIHFDCTSTAMWSLNVVASEFKSNNATVKGGAIYYSYKQPQFSDVIYQNNSALYGPDIASYAFKIKMIDNEQMTINDVGSNIKYEYEVKFALIDYDGQVMVLNDVSQVVISPVDSTVSAIKGVNSALLRNGVATFDNLVAVAKYGSKNVKFAVNSKAIDSAKIKEVYGLDNNDNIITMNFRDWKPGESIVDNYSCQECSAGSYSLQWNSPECSSWIDNVVWLGRDRIEVNPEYWRMTTNSTKIVECINKDAWDGGYNPLNEYPVNWAEGYSGVLWTDCQITESTKYQKVNDYECQKWPNMALNTIRIVGVGLAVFVFFMILIVINVRKTKESEVSVLFRIMTNYFQLITTSMSFSSSYPSSLTDIFTPMKNVGGASDSFLSFDWFITDYDVRGPFPSNSIFKLFLSALLPIILTLIVSLIWLAVHYVHRKWAPVLLRCLIISFISIVFLLHPKLTEQSISLLRWVDIDGAESRVMIDTSIKWYSVEHFVWLWALTLPILIVWVAGCPLIALVLLFMNIKKDDDNKAKQYLLILYQGLKKDKFYWEFINTLRKILLLFTLMFSDTLKVLFSTTLLYVTIRLQLYLKPYKEDKNNKIEILALTAGLATLLSSIIFISDEPVDFINLCILIFIILINTKFILEWSYLLLQWANQKIKSIQILSILLEFALWKKYSSTIDLGINDSFEVTRQGADDIKALPAKNPSKKLLKGPKKVKRIRRMNKTKNEIHAKWQCELRMWEESKDHDYDESQGSQLDSNSLSDDLKEIDKNAPAKVAKSQFFKNKFNEHFEESEDESNDIRANMINSNLSFSFSQTAVKQKENMRKVNALDPHRELNSILEDSNSVMNLPQ